MVRVINKILVCTFVALMVSNEVYGQSVETQLKWLTNPKGWHFNNALTFSYKNESKDKTDEHSPCVLSGNLYFNTNGTYRQVYTKKDCPMQKIEDEQGTWTYIVSPQIQQGILRIELQDTQIGHYFRSYQITAFDENTLTMWRNIRDSYEQTLHIYVLNGSQSVGAVDQKSKSPAAEATMYASIDEVRAVFTEAEIAAADVAAKTSYLSLEEKGVLMYTNLARMVPKKFSTLLKNHIATMTASKQKEYESSPYYQSLQKQLMTMQPLYPLLPDQEMYKLAKCWAEESGKKGLTGHNRQDCDGGQTAENCSYGFPTAIKITMQLLIDEGVESLGHRENLFTTAQRGFGVSIAKHKIYGWCAVEDFGSDTDRDREERLRMKAEFDKTLTQWTPEEQKAADVCRSLSYLSDFEKDFLFYYNLIRINPSKFHALVWKDKPMFMLRENYGSSPKDKLENYTMVKDWLATAKPRAAVVPGEVATREAHCVATRLINQEEKADQCLTQKRFWTWAYNEPDEYYNCIMNVFVQTELFTRFLDADNPTFATEKVPDFQSLMMLMIF